MVLDLRIAHEHFGSSSDPSLNGNLHYPNDIDRSLNEDDTDKIRKYHSDCSNNPPRSVSFKTHRETDHFFAPSGVFTLTNLPVDSSTSSSRCSLVILNQKSAVPSPRLHLYMLTLTLTGHLSLQEHSSLSLGVPVPRATQCM